MTSVSTEIHTLGAAEMAAAVRDGSLTPLEIAEALLARIDEYDGRLEAFSYLNRDEVLAEATALTEEARAGKLRGPLHGVPFGAKEQFAVGGVATRGDWKASDPPIAAEDATVITRLKAAGALLMGKLYMVGPSGVPPTRNPWNLEHTPGGSSSGSGAAVGGRLLPFALAEQTAGSGLRPAAYCGVSALKPTYGRNSRYGMFQLAWSHDHACIIGTSIRDVAQVFESTCGYDAKDPSSVDTTATPFQPLTRPPRIGVVRNFFPELTEPEMQAAIDSSAQKLAAAGAEVVDFMFPEEFGVSWPNWVLVMSAESHVLNMKAGGSPTFTNVVRNVKSRWMTTVRDVVSLMPSPYYLQAQRLRRYLRDLTDESLAPFDAVLMATAPGEAPRDLTGSGDPSLLLPWSHMGQPTINISGGLSSSGMPLGLQLASPSMTDEKLMAVGAWCEDVLGLLPVPEISRVP